MSRYNYLIASLPYLSYESDPPMDLEDFLGQCRTQMGDTDYGAMTLVRLFPGTPSQDMPPLLRAWDEWETSLRNDLVRLRAGNSGRDAERFVRATDLVPETFHVAREAFGQASPRSAEEILDRARWRFLDYAEAGHYFDLERLVVYSLKLQLLLRRSRMTVQQGTANYGQIYNSIRETLSGGNAGRDQTTGADS